MVQGRRRLIKLLFFAFSLMAFTTFLINSDVTLAAPGESSTVLDDQIVSYVNASCHADPIGDCPGSYHEPVSRVYLYVPTTQATASVTINDVLSYNSSNQPVGTGLTNFLLGANVGGGCSPITDVTNPTSGTTLSTANNVAGIYTITSPLEGVTYNRFCVTVQTGPGKSYPIRENVRYRLNSPAGTLLGVYPGASNTGTGFFGGTFPGGPAWSRDVAFSHPCAANTGVGQAAGRNSMTFYDLDTYAADSRDMKIIVQKTLKPFVPSPAPDGGVFGATYNIALTGSVTPTAKGLPNQYTFNNGPTGSSWTVSPRDEDYSSRYIYSVLITGIGSGNKIRITLPYDQVYSKIICRDAVTNTAPEIEFTFDTCTATGVVSFDVRRVRDAQAGTLSINGGYGDVAVAAGAWTNFTAPDFNGIRDGVAHTVTLTVTDPGGLTDTASADYTCTIPPPVVTCVFVNPAQTLEVGDAYYPVVRVTNTNVAGAPTINASTDISVNFVPVQTRNTPSSGPIAVGGSATYGAGSAPTVTYPSTPATGAIVTSAGNFTATGSASYVATAGGYSGTIPCTGSLGVGGNGGSGVFRPYFKVLGGDIVTYGTTVRGYNQQGVTFDPITACTTAIRCGAGVESALQVQGTIDGVPSRFKQATGGLGQKTLTYANTLGGAFATWGGGFGGGVPTVAYNTPAGASNFPGFVSIGANTETEYTYNSANLAGGTLSSGSRVTIYRTGNLRITSNIVYAGSGGYANRDSIPHLRIIVTGNIYIDPAVNQIDGEYISLGQIYTCHNGVWAVPIATNIHDACDDSSLIVNGALVGDSIKLTRTVGTRRNAQTSDGNTGGCVAPTAVSRGYCNTTNIAEIIQFTPELFVARPASSPDNETSTGKYNSITSLPPLF